MAQPHPPGFYTSRLTSPRKNRGLTLIGMLSYRVNEHQERFGVDPDPATGHGDATVPWVVNRQWLITRCAERKFRMEVSAERSSRPVRGRFFFFGLLMHDFHFKRSVHQ
jgi:hypothetical protein